MAPKLSGMARMLCQSAGIDPDQVDLVLLKLQDVDPAQIKNIVGSAESAVKMMNAFPLMAMGRLNQIYEQQREILATIKGQTYAPIFDTDGKRIQASNVVPIGRGSEPGNGDGGAASGGTGTDPV